MATTRGSSGQDGGSEALTRRKFVVMAGSAVVAVSVGAGTAEAAAGPASGQGGKVKTAGRTSALNRAKAPTGKWLAGDTHVHDDHSSDGSGPRQTSHQALPGNLPVGDQIAQGEKAGLDFMPLTDHRTYDQVWDPQWKSSNCC